MVAGSTKVFKPTAEQRNLVKKLSELGLKQETIATLVRNTKKAKTSRNPNKGISTSTLKKYFAEELAAGVAKQDELIAQTLMKQMKEHPSVSMFLAKVRLGWNPAIIQEIDQKEEKVVTHVYSPMESDQAWIEAVNPDNNQIVEIEAVEIPATEEKLN